MATKKKPAKDRIKAKAGAVKSRVKGKVKASVAVMAAILSLVLYEGCSTATPASRATTASYEINVKVCMDEGVKSATVNVPFTFGDGALASADSSGSTETQTATPTLDIKPDVDLNYAQGGGISTGGGRAASGVAGIIESLAAEGLATLKDWVTNKKSGTVTLAKKDGSTVTAECKDGSCTFSDGTVVTAEDCANCTANK